MEYDRPRSPSRRRVVEVIIITCNEGVRLGRFKTSWRLGPPSTCPLARGDRDDINVDAGQPWPSCRLDLHHP